MKVPQLKSSTRRDPDYVLSRPPQTEQLDPGEPADGNLLSVRKPTVGRTHSLPNDSYMFLPPQPLGHVDRAQLLTQSQAPQHIQSTRRAQSGTAEHLYTPPTTQFNSSSICLHLQLIMTAGLTGVRLVLLSVHSVAFTEKVTQLASFSWFTFIKTCRNLKNQNDTNGWASEYLDGPPIIIAYV